MEILNSIKVIPVTSRCEQSYKNIYLKSFFSDALVDNGAILVTDDTILYNLWIKKSREIVNEDSETLHKIKSILKEYGLQDKWGSEFTADFFRKDISKNEILEISTLLKKYEDNFLINIGKDYVLVSYKKLSKGENIKRYANLFNKNILLTAGDNLEDISMFKYSKYSIGKDNSTFIIKSENKLDFCDKVLNKSYEIIKKEA